MNVLNYTSSLFECLILIKECEYLLLLPSTPNNISHKDFLAHCIGLIDEFSRALRQRLQRIEPALGIKKQFAPRNHPVVQLVELAAGQCAHESLDADAVVSPGESLQGSHQLLQCWLEVFGFEMVLVHHDALNDCTEFLVLVVVSNEFVLV